MITKDIDIDGEKFRVILTEQVIGQVNNLKSLYAAAYEDPESFEQISAQISDTIQEIASSVEPATNDSHLDGLIQEIIKIVDTQKAEKEKETKEKTKKEITKKVKPKK